MFLLGFAIIVEHNIYHRPRIGKENKTALSNFLFIFTKNAVRVQSIHYKGANEKDVI